MRYMTIGDVIAYVDGIKQNSFSGIAKTVWLNEIEYRVQSEVMLLAAENVRDYVYSDSMTAAGIIYGANTIRLPKRLRARAGGRLTITGSVNPGSYAVSGVSEDGMTIIVDAELTEGTDNTKALAEFDGSDCELIVPAPWSEIYYDYLLMKMSEHLEESSEQNNRAATFNKAFTRFMRWWADTYNPSNGKALFKGYYLKGDKGDPFVYENFTAEQLEALKGYTPVRGTDYWTVDDIAAIQSYIDDATVDSAASVVIEGTASDDMSEVTITTPDAWTLISEAWNSEKRPLVVLRLSDTIYAYLTGVSSADLNGQPFGFAIFSIPSIYILDGSPPKAVVVDDANQAAVFVTTDSAMSDTSVNAVQNKVVKKYIDDNTQPKSITDEGGYFTTDTVEGALQEIGAELAGINTLLGSGEITS